MAAILRRVGLGFFLVLLTLTAILYTRVGTPVRVYAAPSENLNFQARLLSSSGALVADGNYSVQFKLYTTLTGGTAAWTETQATTVVKNGYLSVYLGSVNNTLSALDWSQQYYLTMNVAADGEMSPRLQLTSVPYAFRSARADTLTNGAGTLGASDLAQLAPSTIQVINSALAALRLNQTGSGGLIQFQANGIDAFTLSKTGNIITTGTGLFQGASLEVGTATQSGGLVLHDGTNNTATLRGLTLSANQTYDLPNASGTICLEGSASCGFVTSGGVAGAFVNNGNTFPGLATLGTNDNFGLEFETNGTTKMTILPDGNVGIALASPTATLGVNGRTASSGATMMTGVSGTSLLTTSASITLNVGDYVMPTTTSGQARAISVGGTGTTFTVTPAFSANVTLETFTIYRPITRLATDTGAASLVAQGSTGRVGIGTATPLALFSVGTGSAFQVDNSGTITAATATNTINGLVINSGTLSSINGATFASGNLNLASGGIAGAGAVAGVTTLAASGAITGATATNTINGLIVNSGALSGITGFTQTAGNFAMSGTGTFATGTGTVELNGATTITNGSAVAGLTITQSGNAANISATNTANTTGALISLTQSTSAYSGTGLLFNFASGSGSFASGNFLDFQVNTVSKFKIDNSGALTLNSTSTGALAINNASGLSYFSVDTSGGLVRVGSATADGTGVLLVFDSKNTFADPTSVEGGEYYNSKRGNFRCSENGRGFTDCLGIPKPNTRRTTNLTHPGSGTAFSLFGDIATAGTAPTSIATSATEPSSLNYATGAIIGNVNHVSGNTNYDRDSNIAFQTRVTVAETTLVRVWAGITTGTAVTMSGADAPATTSFAAFRYSTNAVDTTWKCVTSNGTTQTVADSGVAITAVGVNLEVILTGTIAEFKINGDEVCAVSTTLPAANTLLRYANTTTTLSVAVRNLRVSWIYLENDR